MALPPSQVHVVHLEGAGAYGQNGSEDVAADAAVLAREVGRPVRVQWSRSDEFVGEPKAAAMLMEASAGLDEEGSIVAWDYQVWSSTHADRPRQSLGLLAGREIRGELPPPPSFFFGGDRNAATTYTVAAHRVTMHWLARPPLRTSSMRSLGGAGNTFANESFMDELAAAAEVDPLEFRLRHLDDPRARSVLEAAARASEWGAPLPPGEGRGIAFARYENTEAYVAMVAHVAVDQESGALQLRRMVVAHDCGLIINPDGVRNQIEGNVIQAASRALKEEIAWDAHGQTTQDWESYPILTFSQVPQIDILLIDRPTSPRSAPVSQLQSRWRRLSPMRSMPRPASGCVRYRLQRSACAPPFGLASILAATRPSSGYSPRLFGLLPDAFHFHIDGTVDADAEIGDDHQHSGDLHGRHRCIQGNMGDDSFR